MGFFDKVKNVVGDTVENGKILAKITQTNVDITVLEKKVETEKKNIGDVIVKNNIELDNADIQNAIATINNCLKEIEEKKAELEKLKEEQKNKKAKSETNAEDVVADTTEKADGEVLTGEVIDSENA